MTNLLPKALEDLIESLGVLPGVGARTAERYAYYLLKSNPDKSKNLAEALGKLHTDVKNCPITFALIDSSLDVSNLYSDPKRNKKIIAVVEEPLDIIAIEKTNKYDGTYHVLGGVINPIDGIGPSHLHIPELIKRILDDNAEEVILATNASVEGESTALYIQKQIAEAGISVTLSRLARGIPVGVDLEYADQITLAHALQGRKTL